MALAHLWTIPQAKIDLYPQVGRTEDLSEEGLATLISERSHSPGSGA